MNSRRLAFQILLKTEEGGYANLLLDQALKRINDKRDRALTTELVYGVLRQKKRLDYIIGSLARRRIKNIDLPVLLALRLGIYQIDFLDRIPDRAAVNETVNILKGKANKGAVGFVNGVLRNYIRNRDVINWPDEEKDGVSYLANYYSHPTWLVSLWIDKYGYQLTRELCRINNLTPEINIRINNFRYKTEDIISELKEAGITVEKNNVPSSYKIGKINNITELPYFQQGGFFVQGQAATLAGFLLDVKPGMRVLDMAAGPGGKTTHLAELMENQGEIIALDVHDHKLDLIEENCSRIGIDIVQTKKVDGREFKTDILFDRILLDAPCSGLGLIAQKPEIKWTKSLQDIKNISIIQEELLKNAITLLKPGGQLLYSTCTLTLEENEGLVGKIGSLYDDQVSLLNLEEDIRNLNLEDPYQTNQAGWLELFPPVSKTEGFFLAKFVKREK